MREALSTSGDCNARYCYLDPEEGARKALHDALRAAIAAGLVASAHDVSEGGLAVTLAECCITNPAGALGARVELDGNGRADAMLFGEGPGRIVVPTSAEHAARLEALTAGLAVPHRRLGEVSGAKIDIQLGADALTSLSGALRRAWLGGLSDLLNR